MEDEMLHKANRIWVQQTVSCHRKTVNVVFCCFNLHQNCFNKQQNVTSDVIMEGELILDPFMPELIKGNDGFLRCTPGLSLPFLLTYRDKQTSFSFSTWEVLRSLVPRAVQRGLLLCNLFLLLQQHLLCRETERGMGAFGSFPPRFSGKNPRREQTWNGRGSPALQIHSRYPVSSRSICCCLRSFKNSCLFSTRSLSLANSLLKRTHLRHSQIHFGWTLMIIMLNDDDNELPTHNFTFTMW